MLIKTRILKITISIICSSIPVAAKFARIYINNPALNTSLYLRLKSKDRDSGTRSSSWHSLPSFKKARANQKELESLLTSYSYDEPLNNVLKSGTSHIKSK